MADFAAWKHDTLVQFAQDSAAENQRLRGLLGQMAGTYAELCNMFCKAPTTNPIYRQAIAECAEGQKP